jgi:hypothetical protein
MRPTDLEFTNVAEYDRIMALFALPPAAPPPPEWWTKAVGHAKCRAPNYVPRPEEIPMIARVGMDDPATMRAEYHAHEPPEGTSPDAPQGKWTNAAGRKHGRVEFVS